MVIFLRIKHCGQKNPFWTWLLRENSAPSIQLLNMASKFGALNLLGRPYPSHRLVVQISKIKAQNCFVFSGSSIVGKNGNFECGCYRQIQLWSYNCWIRSRNLGHWTLLGSPTRAIGWWFRFRRFQHKNTSTAWIGHSLEFNTAKNN